MKPEDFRTAEACKWFDVLGTPISVTDLNTTVKQIVQWSNGREPRSVCFRDVHGIVKALDDPELALAHQSASIIAPDGMPIVWIGKAKGHKIGRTYGPDVMDAIMQQSAASGLSHYLYGGKEGVAAKLKDEMVGLHGSINFAGIETPPFHDLGEPELMGLVSRVKASGANILWIGISSPRQEKLMAKLSPFLSMPILAVGAAFDFHSGTVRQAPRWIRNSGLEWAFRIAAEPNRLAERYLRVVPRFLLLLLLSELRAMFFRPSGRKS
jgi:N-acetylglucosaminyldiphosphoundecaprenol N-acetyl-beta-D-mannosaminyltransferase